MATQRPAIEDLFAAFCGRLFVEREVAPRAQVIAQEASARLRGTPVVVYLFDPEAEPRWSLKGSTGDVKASAKCEALTLASVADQNVPVLFSHDQLVREHYAHLDVRRTIASLAYVPLLDHSRLLGAIEAISFDRPLTNSDLNELGLLAEVGSRAIAGALSYEAERNSNLETITRLTSFYDVERVFHSTLHIGRLLPIIASKTRELLPCEAVNVWMVEGDELKLHARDGQDRTLPIGASQDQVIALVGDTGQPMFVKDRHHPSIAKRNHSGSIRELLAVPIIDGGALVGALECINKRPTSEQGERSTENARATTRFDDDDLFLLTTIAETAGGALHNASLLEAERKIEILETLVEVSQEITSTLNLTRVLQVIVNAPQRIMSYDRAAVALGHAGKLSIRALSGKPEVVQADPAVKALHQMLAVANDEEGELYVTTRSAKVVTDRESVIARFRDYFQQTGYRTWYSIPLADDQGQLGVLVFEGKKPDFLSEAQIELVKVMAAQATVALRNASLYEQVPLIGLLEPILHRKQKFMKVEKHRRLAYAGIAAAVLVLLVAVPLPMRVEGGAVVAPQRTAAVGVGEDSIVRAVRVREGDTVKRGTVLAELEDWDVRAALAAAEAKRQQALAQMNEALAGNDGGQAGTKRSEAEYWAAEVRRAQERVDRTLLRSPIDGVVATPHLETMVGRKLLAGETLAQVLDAGRASIDVAIDQRDLALVATGQGASVKLEAYPTEKFRGKVEIVSPASGVMDEGGANKRVFYARVDVGNEAGLMRAGMEGEAKVMTGWRPAGYVMFRGIGLWGWTKIWSWFGS